MPLYMDLHKVQGVTPQALANAHLKDLDVQEKYGVRYLRYWFNEPAGKIFCLADAPSAEAAITVHRESHGLLPEEIIEVEGRDVEGFLGTTDEVPRGQTPPPDNAFRAILFTDMEGSTALTQQLGDKAAMEVMHAHDAIIDEALAAHGGSRVKHTGDGVMASFASVAQAVACAVSIQRGFARHNDASDHPIRVRLGLSAGEPVEEHNDLFGASVQLAARICAHAGPDEILVANVIRELCIGKGFSFEDRGDATLRGFDAAVRLHAVRWREGD
jgi:class 3 adenylate cyclase